MPQIVIESDGTRAGTELRINGTKVENLRNLWFDVDSWSRDASLGYSVSEEDKENNMVVTTSYSFDPSLASFVKESTKEESANDDIDIDDFKLM